MSKKKIAILLPFKDHFTNSKAGSTSIWVKDFNKKSKYKDQISIYGNTPFLNDLIDKKKYKNITLEKINIGSKQVKICKNVFSQNGKHVSGSNILGF